MIDKTKEELLLELVKLKKENAVLKAIYEKESTESISNKEVFPYSEEYF